MTYFIAGLAAGLGILIAMEDKGEDDDQRDGIGHRSGGEALYQRSPAGNSNLYGGQGKRQ